MYLGIEIGGTKLQLGIGNGDGSIRCLWRGTVVPTDGAEGIRRQIDQAIPQLLASANLQRDNLRGVGIGFGGPVDDATRSVIKSHQIQGWDGFALADWIEQIVGLPAVLGNDADVAGFAEALFGAGEGLSPIFYITIGSGIGGGLIINGEIYRGCGRGAAEIGHLYFRTERHQEPKGVPLEELASGWAIGEEARKRFEYIRLHCPILFGLADGKREHLSAQLVCTAAENGEKLPMHILTQAWGALADGIVQVITLLCPRRIVVGGGVSLMGATLFEPLRRMVAERVFGPFAECYDIVPAALGEEVVIHGALALARKRLT
ncbi:MAG TPA: ROK family protein [Gemmataceae bacterium]|nr:ROK family protein [Gemmataceae bacterium]